MQTYSERISVKALVTIAAGLFVGLDGGICAAGKKALGVSEVAADQYEQISPIQSGVVLVTSGAAVTAGDAVVSDAAGKAVPATAVTVTIPADSTPVTSDAAQPTLVVAGGLLPQAINGYAIDTASEEGETIRVKLV